MVFNPENLLFLALLLPLVVFVVVLFRAAMMDIKDRRVPHCTWWPVVLAGLAGLPVLYWYLWSCRGPGDAVVFAVFSVVGVIMAYFGAVRWNLYGGSDAVAMMLLCGFFPAYLAPPLFFSGASDGLVMLPFFPVAVMLNGGVLGASVWLYKRAVLGFGSYTLPLIPFILAGILTALLFGDFVGVVMGFFVGL